MAGEAQDDIWPLPKFHFNVQIGGEDMACQEVSGLDIETEVIEYRAGNSKVFSKIKMPGMIKSSNVTLKKGVFAKNNKLFDWFSTINMNTIERKDMVISLLDEAGAPTMTWKFVNVFPTKLTGTDLKAEGNEVAVETIEIAHEGFVVENA